MDRPRGPRRIGLLPDRIAIAGPGIALLRSDPGYVERAHALGNQVYVWTVDEPADLDAGLSSSASTPSSPTGRPRSLARAERGRRSADPECGPMIA